MRSSPPKTSRQEPLWKAGNAPSWTATSRPYRAITAFTVNVRIAPIVRNMRLRGVAADEKKTAHAAANSFMDHECRIALNPTKAAVSAVVTSTSLYVAVRSAWTQLRRLQVKRPIGCRSEVSRTALRPTRRDSRCVFGHLESIAHLLNLRCLLF